MFYESWWPCHPVWLRRAFSNIQLQHYFRLVRAKGCRLSLPVNTASSWYFDLFLHTNLVSLHTLALECFCSEDGVYAQLFFHNVQCREYFITCFMPFTEGLMLVITSATLLAQSTLLVNRCLRTMHSICLHLPLNL